MRNVSFRGDVFCFKHRFFSFELCFIADLRYKGFIKKIYTCLTQSLLCQFRFCLLKPPKLWKSLFFISLFFTNISLFISRSAFLFCCSIMKNDNFIHLRTNEIYSSSTENVPSYTKSHDCVIDINKGLCEIECYDS